MRRASNVGTSHNADAANCVSETPPPLSHYFPRSAALSPRLPLGLPQRVRRTAGPPPGMDRSVTQ